MQGRDEERMGGDDYVELVQVADNDQLGPVSTSCICFRGKISAIPKGGGRWFNFVDPCSRVVAPIC